MGTLKPLINLERIARRCTFKRGKTLYCQLCKKKVELEKPLRNHKEDCPIRNVIEVRYPAKKVKIEEVRHKYKYYPRFREKVEKKAFAFHGQVLRRALHIATELVLFERCFLVKAGDEVAILEPE